LFRLNTNCVKRSVAAYNFLNFLSAEILERFLYDIALQLDFLQDAKTTVLRLTSKSD